MPSHSSRRRRRQPVRQMSQKSSQQQRKTEQRSALQPIDYSVEYVYVRHDLKRIAIWSAALFAGMFVVFFFI